MGLTLAVTGSTIAQFGSLRKRGLADFAPLPIHHGRPHIGANEVSWKNGSKIKKRKHAKTAVFLNGLWGQRRYADQIFIQIYFRMHHFVVRFSKFSSPRAARGIDPPNQNPADIGAIHLY